MRRESRPISQRAATAAAALDGEFKGRLGRARRRRAGRRDRALRAARGRLGRVDELRPAAVRRATATTRRSAASSRACRSGSTTIGTRLLFVTLELNQLEDDALAAKLAASPRLAHYRPWLRDVRSFRPHQLADEIEQMLHEKTSPAAAPGSGCSTRPWPALRFPLDGKELTSAEIFDLLSAKDRGRARAGGGADQRRAGAATSGCSRLITNTLAKDKQIEDSWRKFARPISSRNLANQVEDEVVDALIAAVARRLPAALAPLLRAEGALARPGAAGVLGPQRAAARGRRHAPALGRGQGGRARRLPHASRRAGRDRRPVLRAALDRRRSCGPGKDSGAFCHPTVPSAHPYLLMNYQGRSRAT